MLDRDLQHNDGAGDLPAFSRQLLVFCCCLLSGLMAANHKDPKLTEDMSQERQLLQQGPKVTLHR